MVRINLTQSEGESQAKSHLGPVIAHFIAHNNNPSITKQVHLAKELGVSRATVTGWVKGKHAFELANLQAMLKAFRINFLEFAMVADDLTPWGKFNPSHHSK